MYEIESIFFNHAVYVCVYIYIYIFMSQFRLKECNYKSLSCNTLKNLLFRSFLVQIYFNWCLMTAFIKPKHVARTRSTARYCFNYCCDELYAILGYYAAQNGNSVPTLRDNISVPSLWVKGPRRNTRRRLHRPLHVSEHCEPNVTAYTSHACWIAVGQTAFEM